MTDMNKTNENERLKKLLKKIDEDNSPELENEILEMFVVFMDNRKNNLWDN